jgi:hypothetical protein
MVVNTRALHGAIVACRAGRHVAPPKLMVSQKVMFWMALQKVRDTACESPEMKRTCRTLQ